MSLSHASALDVESGISQREQILHVVPRDDPSVARLHGQTLDLHSLLSSARSSLDLLVLAHAVEEIIAASGLLHVLNAHMDLLADDAVAVKLVHLDSDGARSHVPHDSGLTWRATQQPQQRSADGQRAELNAGHLRSSRRSEIAAAAWSIA